jgi:GNAT superfamily N-acetyltransferase
VSVRIRKIQARDRSRLEEILNAQQHFRAAEIQVALELIDLALGHPHEEEYLIQCAENDEGEIAGYICYGKAPLTDAVFDLYWIVVHPHEWHQGTGTSLLRWAEEDLVRRKARILFIETSSLPAYEGPRMFYRKHGFQEQAKLLDYYRIGDHKVIFGKRFRPVPEAP